MVDDDETSRLALKAVLEPWGFVVIEVQDGKAALEMISSLVIPDILITDVAMPAVGGAALISHLRAGPLTHAIPILIVSADPGVAQALRMSGQADAVVTKPVDAETLTQCISVLARKSWLAERAGMGAD